MGGTGERLAVLQDDQRIGDENSATSLLVFPSGGQLGERKTRVAAQWLELGGWRTQLIERRHHGDIAITHDDPPYLLSGLDDVRPRLVLAQQGFAYMIDTGVGHGPGDFEGIQVRVIAKDDRIEDFWGTDVSSAQEHRVQTLLARQAYQQLDPCGAVRFAEASVAVPFVGAAAGALTLAQTIRLASLESASRLLQVELNAPDMATFGGLTGAPAGNLGSISVLL